MADVNIISAVFLTGDQSISGVKTFTTTTNYGAPILVEGTSAADGGPGMAFYHNSASPLADDGPAFFDIYGNSSTGVKRKLVTWGVAYSDPTNAAEAALLDFATIQAGTLASRFQVGAGFYTTNATGGDKGADTVNASALYTAGIKVPLNNLVATTNPGVGDDDADGYSVGSHWYNVTLDLAWYCIDASTGAAAWKPVDGHRSWNTAVRVSHTGNTSETVLGTFTIPAGWPGANGSIRSTHMINNNNSAGSKTVRIRLGGIAGTTYWSDAQTTNINRFDRRQIWNRNSQASQVGGASGAIGAGGTGSGALVTSTVDLSAGSTLVITGQLSDGADNIALEAWTVEMMYGA